MRKATQLMPGDAKTDARDAFVIATTKLWMPDTLRAVDRNSEILASLKILAGYDDDLAREPTRSGSDRCCCRSTLHWSGCSRAPD